MTPTQIKSQIEKQLTKADSESHEFFFNIWNKVNIACPIKSFKLGINTSDQEQDIHSNISIITFETEPEEIQKDIIMDTIYYNIDECPDFKFMDNILIISFDF